MSVADQAHKAEQFRALHLRGKPLVLLNVWDAGSAKAVAAGGAKAIATSSWSVANSNGFADGERIPRALAIENLGRIVATVEVPVSVDLESGYADRADCIEETIGLAIDAGAVGCNLEDSFPTTGKLRETLEQVNRIRHARRAAETTKIRFFINARTDVFFQQPPEKHDENLVVQAIHRARAYAEAGADGLFATGLASLSLIGRLVEASPLPVNIMVADSTPCLCELAERGIARVSHGPRPYLLAMKALEETACRASS